MHFQDNRITFPLIDFSALEQLLHLQPLKGHFERLFKTHIDCSPSHYCLQLRLNHAHRFLRARSPSIRRVATACGAGSSPQFFNPTASISATSCQTIPSLAPTWRISTNMTGKH